MDKTILRNRIKCLVCGGYAESKHVHDYAECPCGACAADGGREYLKRAYTYRDGKPCYTECSEWRNADAPA